MTYPNGEIARFQTILDTVVTGRASGHDARRAHRHWSVGETLQVESPAWMAADVMTATLASSGRRLHWAADVYARVVEGGVARGADGVSRTG